MKRLLIFSIICACLAPVHAQFLKKLKSKVDQSAKDVKAKVKDKAETAPDRVVDHTANKVETKAESKIDNKENKANGTVDKTVDKVDSIKIKKVKTEEAKDSTKKNTRIIFLNEVKKKTPAPKNTELSLYNLINKAISYSHKHNNPFI
ncbi:hypothetical protein [Ferruginibacter sp. SUN106]|uniref:hypothetical protein n=1 Tax=Ferruginibacter sp. SUN106 TaxID=2978348 RepID=UPI003D36E55F